MQKLPTMKVLFSVIITILTFVNSFSQCNSWDNYPDGKEKAIEQHVLYRDKLKAKKFVEAYPIWSELFKSVQVPLPSKRIHYLDGIDMSLYFSKTDTANREMWLSKVDTLWDNFFKCNGEDVDYRNLQGYHLLLNGWKLEKAHSVFKNIIFNNVSKVPPSTISYLSRVSTYLYKTSKIDSVELLSIWKRMELVVSKNWEKDSVNLSKYWTDAQNQFKSVEEIFDCDYWSEKWNQKKAQRLSIDSLQFFMNKISKTCNDSLVKSEIYWRIWEIRKNLAIEEEFLVLSKDTTTVYRKILSYYTLAQYDTLNSKKWNSERENLYEELSGSEKEWVSDDVRSREIYRYAYKLYVDKNFISSRNYCRVASRFCPNWADPFILTGLMYVDGLNVDNFENRTRVWVAIDEWNRGKKAEPSKFEVCESLIRKYSIYLPTKSELFQRVMPEGGVWTIEGWIQQATRIWGI